MPYPPHRRRAPLASLFTALVAVALATTMMPVLGGSPVRAAPPPEWENCSQGDVAGSLPAGARSISGTVKDVGGVGIEGVQVRITESGGGLQVVRTEPDGTYAMGGIADGSYTIGLYDETGHHQGGFRGASGVVLTPADAQPVVLSGASAGGVDVVLPDERYFEISGELTDHIGAGVDGITLSAASPYFPMASCGTSTPDGSYAIFAVRTGVYRVEVNDPTDTHPSGFYSDAVTGGFVPDFNDATLVVSDGAATPGIDIRFPETFTLSGTVTESGAAPVEGVYVTACLVDGGACRDAPSGPDGSFMITRLVPGDFIVQETGGGAGYLNGYYAGPNTFSLDVADAIQVAVAADVTGLELWAERAATASGSVTDANGTGLADIIVSLQDPTTFEDGDAITNPDGTFVTTALQPGTYQVRLMDQRSPKVYPTGYLAATGSLVIDPADAVQVAVGTTDLSGLDVEIPDAGAIDVSVVMDGAPVPIGFVHVCVSFPEACAESEGTDENGVVSFPAILPGSYVVGTDTEEGARWYVAGGPAVEDQGSATLVSIASGSTTTIELSLSSAGDAGTPTPVGADQEVALDDGTGATPVNLTFAEVTGAGTTTLTIPPGPPSTPVGFQFGVPPLFYEIETTATFEGEVRVCITFDPTSFADPAGVRLLHFVADPTPGAWVDITDPPIDANGLICGITDTFSPFVLVERTYPFGGFHGIKPPPNLNKAKPGDKVGVEFSLGGNLGTEIFETGSPTSQDIDCASLEPTGGAEAALAGTLKYRAKSARYTYQWKTSKTWKKSCRVLTLTFKDGSSAEALFTFK